MQNFQVMQNLQIIGAENSECIDSYNEMTGE